MEGRKVFMDPIHGLIDLHPLLVKIIDTPEFQRLRNIKQLGMCYYVYPGASHNRFEHSIGVCHLAGRFVMELRAKLQVVGAKLQDAGAKLKDAGAKLKDAGEKLQEADGKIPDADGKLHDADGKLHDAGAKLKDAGANLHDAGVKLQDPDIKLQDADGKLQDAGAELQEAGAKLKDAGAKLRDADGKLQEAGAKLKDADGKLQYADGKLQDADGKLQDAGEKLKEAGANLQDAGAKLQDADIKLQDADGKLQDAGDKLQDAGAKLQDAGARLKLDVTPEDVLCVEIAGLCHDLGHGPFSHAFDSNLVKDIIAEVEKEGAKIKDKTFSEHEERSVAVLRHLIKGHNLMPLFNRYKLSEKDIDFIGELITASEGEDTEDWTFDGRTKEKAFLYEIVSNMRHGIDVDKWDYFARDCHMLGIKNDFDHNRCIQFARVVMVKGRSHICYRDKEVHNLYEMFHTRFNLHVRAYQHKTSQILDYEVADVLWEVRDDKDFKINDKTLKQIILDILDGDMKAFCLLTDDILSDILRKPDNTCTEAKKRIGAIYSREVPHIIGQTSLTYQEKQKLGTDVELKRELLKGMSVKPEDVVVRMVNLDYGKKDEQKKGLNPIDYVYFYKKNEPNKTFNIEKNQVSRLLPDEFSETKVRVYCRDKEQCNALADRFTEWCNEKGYPLPISCTPAS